MDPRTARPMARPMELILAPPLLAAHRLYTAPTTALRPAGPHTITVHSTTQGPAAGLTGSEGALPR